MIRWPAIAGTTQQTKNRSPYEIQQQQQQKSIIISILAFEEPLRRPCTRLKTYYYTDPGKTYGNVTGRTHIRNATIHTIGVWARQTGAHQEAREDPNNTTIGTKPIPLNSIVIIHIFCMWNNRFTQWESHTQAIALRFVFGTFGNWLAGWLADWLRQSLAPLRAFAGPSCFWFCERASAADNNKNASSTERKFVYDANAMRRACHLLDVTGDLLLFFFCSCLMRWFFCALLKVILLVFFNDVWLD